METHSQVLIIDDHLRDVQWLLDLIENRGHEIVVATNEQAGRERLRAVREGTERYSLAIIDVMVATHDLLDIASFDRQFFEESKDSGLRLCRYAREELELPEERLPIVSLTIRQDDTVVREMRRLGIKLYIRDQHDQQESIRAFIDEKLGPPRKQRDSEATGE